MHSIIRAVSSSPTAAVAVSVVAVAVACVVRLSRSRVRDTAMEGLDEEKYTISQMNLDQSPARRRVREAFIPIQQNLDHCLFKVRFIFSFVNVKIIFFLSYQRFFGLVLFF